MTTFPSRVGTNTTNLQAAIDLGCVPMERMYETMRDRLPYFGNQVVGPVVGSVYFANYSIAHVPGRWLNALLSAEAAIGRPADQPTPTLSTLSLGGPTALSKDLLPSPSSSILKPLPSCPKPICTTCVKGSMPHTRS